MSTSPWKSRSNKNSFKLLKAVEKSREEARLYGVQPIRNKAYKGVVIELVFWDLPQRSSGGIRSWKNHRKMQYK